MISLEIGDVAKTYIIGKELFVDNVDDSGDEGLDVFPSLHQCLCVTCT